MKSLAKKIASILLVSSMFLMLFGCGSSGESDQKKLVGTWKATVDMTELMNDSIQQGMGEGDQVFNEYFQISKFDFVVIFTFRDDGTYSITTDEAHFNNSITTVIDELKIGMRRYLEDMLAAQGLDMSLDDLLAEEGTSLDALFEESLPSSMFDSMADEFKVTGKWKAEKGKLFTTENAGEDVSDSTYDLYEFISDNEIKLTLPDGAVDDTGLYPIVLKKSA